MAQEEAIQVLIYETGEQLPGRRMVPGTGTMVARVIDVPISVMKQSIEKVTEQVSEIVRDVTTNESLVRLDQITVDLSVSANGSVQWVAGLGAAAGSTVTLTFRVSDKDDEG